MTTGSPPPTARELRLLIEGGKGREAAARLAGVDLTAALDRNFLYHAAISLDVPILPGESVLTPGIVVRESADGSRVARVGLERGQMRTQWTSSLARTDSLELTLRAGEPRTEALRMWRRHVVRIVAAPIA